MVDLAAHAHVARQVVEVLDPLGVGVGPQLVILDIALPACNGFYWCMEIRKTSKVPIIFISSADDNMNIADMTNISKGEYAYTMIDIDSDVTDSVIEDLTKVKDVLRVRVIR